MDRTEIEANLSDSEFFNGLDNDAIGKIADLCKVKTFDSWAYLFRQGEPGETLYVVVNGQVLLERAINLGDKKGSVVIATLGHGRICGCWSTLLDASHTLMSSATCQEPPRRWP
jgi:CRP/FNR family transcriptional regulator, cyclic AMP receptor protein